MAGVFQTAAVISDAETHRRWTIRHAKLVQQPTEIWVRAVIEDNEPRVYPLRFAVDVHRDRIGVPTGVTSGFKNGDAMLCMKPVRGCEPGNSSTNDRNVGSHHRQSNA
jgi:hypothetical protein